MIFSVASGVKTEKGASNTFQAYQASVSDAWDIEVSWGRGSLIVVWQ